MSNLHVLCCLAPLPKEALSSQLQIFYAIPAEQIARVGGDLDVAPFNPLGFVPPHAFSITLQDRDMPMGEQLRFIQLSAKHRIPHPHFLGNWMTSLGITDIYRNEDQLYLLLDTTLLLDNSTMDKSS